MEEPSYIFREDQPTTVGSMAVKLLPVREEDGVQCKLNKNRTLSEDKPEIIISEQNEKER